MLRNPVARLFARRVPSSVSPTEFRSQAIVPRADEIDQFPLRERQESLLLERVPVDLSSAESLSQLTGVSSSKILVMKSLIGDHTGRVCLLVGPDEVPSNLPAGALTRPLDITDTELFVEQCERFHDFTRDVRRLATEAADDGFNRVVTLSGVPKSFSRKDVAALISEATKHSVTVSQLRDVVFRFKPNGQQSDTCFVLMKSETEALQVIKAVQEYPAPLRRVYGTSFGCSFVFADRSALFITDPSLDYQLEGSKYWVMTLGWNSELDESQMAQVLHKMAIYPNKVVKVASGGVGGEFLLRFDRMKNTKLVFTRLNRLKRRWRIPSNTPFFAYPVRADIHYSGDTVHEDQRDDCDSDLDEPVMY